MLRSALPLLLLAAACGEEVGIPQPDPVPKVSLIRTSRSAAAGVDVVGLPGSVAGGGTVTVEGAKGQVQGPAAGAGSFSVRIEASPEEELRVRYNRSEPVLVRVPPVPPPPPPSTYVPPGPIAGIPPLSAAGPGRVRIRGATTDVPVGTILGVNPSLGEVVVTVPAADRSFSLELPAATGHELRVYDDNGGPLRQPWVLLAP